MTAPNVSKGKKAVHFGAGNIGKDAEEHAPILSPRTTGVKTDASLVSRTWLRRLLPT